MRPTPRAPSGYSRRAGDLEIVRTGERALPVLPIDIAAYVRLHVACIVTLVVFCLAGQTSRLAFGHDRLLGFVRDFNLDDERNVPTWFQSGTLLFAAILAELVSRARRDEHPGEAGRWRILAIGLALLSIDEAASFHERMRLPIRFFEAIPGYHPYSWVVPALVLVIGVGLWLLPWLNRLPGRTRRLIGLAGMLYLVGAMGFEAIGGLQAITTGTEGWLYVATYVAEETLEMCGVLVMIFALLDFLRRIEPVPVLTGSEPAPDERA